MSKGHLKITVLKLLSGNELSGYELMKSMEAKIGWKPSPGSIYPLLSDLRKKKLVQIKIEGRKKLYQLTPLGKRMFQTLNAQKKALVNEMQNNMRILTVVGDKQEAQDMEMILRLMKEKEGHLSWLHEDAVVLRRSIFQLADKQFNSKEQEKIKNIIRKTAQQLRTYI